jgi:hypothetical protein
MITIKPYPEWIENSRLVSVSIPYSHCRPWADHRLTVLQRVIKEFDGIWDDKDQLPSFDEVEDWLKQLAKGDFCSGSWFKSVDHYHVQEGRVVILAQVGLGHVAHFLISHKLISNAGAIIPEEDRDGHWKQYLDGHPWLCHEEDLISWVLDESEELFGGVK